MAAGATYVPISTQVLSGTATTVTFSSIPSTYTDLRLVINAGMTGVGYAYLYFNGDTAANYSRTEVFGSGTTTASSRFANLIPVTLDTTLGSTSNIIDIFNYTNASILKPIQYKFASSGLSLNGSGLWRSTSAITSLSVVGYSTTTFTVGSVFTLYGIASA